MWTRQVHITTTIDSVVILHRELRSPGFYSYEKRSETESSALIRSGHTPKPCLFDSENLLNFIKLACIQRLHVCFGEAPRPYFEPRNAEMVSIRGTDPCVSLILVLYRRRTQRSRTTYQATIHSAAMKKGARTITQYHNRHCHVGQEIKAATSISSQQAGIYIWVTIRCTSISAQWYIEVSQHGYAQAAPSVELRYADNRRALRAPWLWKFSAHFTGGSDWISAQGSGGAICSKWRQRCSINIVSRKIHFSCFHFTLTACSTFFHFTSKAFSTDCG